MPNALKLALVFAIVGGAAVITYRFVGPKVG
jgi:hypothetical protein